MFADSPTAARTPSYDIPPSIAANSSPQRYSHDAASASRAKDSGSAIRPRLKMRSVGLSKSAIPARYSCARIGLALPDRDEKPPVGDRGRCLGERRQQVLRPPDSRASGHRLERERGLRTAVSLVPENRDVASAGCTDGREGRRELGIGRGRLRRRVQLNGENG